MSALYSLFDILSDVVYNTIEGSDASQFSKLVGGFAPLWGLLWFLLSALILIIAIAASLFLFRPIEERRYGILEEPSIPPALPLQPLGNNTIRPQVVPEHDGSLV